jgi:hypothetical protein
MRFESLVLRRLAQIIANLYRRKQLKMMRVAVRNCGIYQRRRHLHRVHESRELPFTEQADLGKKRFALGPKAQAASVASRIGRSALATVRDNVDIGLLAVLVDGRQRFPVRGQSI